MKVDYELFINSKKENYQKYVNFYNSFGYLHLTNALDKNLVKKCRKEYKRIYEEKNKKSWNEIMRSGVQFFIPNFYEESNFFLHEILLNKILPIANLMSNGKPIYLGSDGSCFNGQSFQWHRDWFAKSRMLKFNIYMNSGLHLGGRHLLIPGTQFTNDEFSQSVGRGGAWPFFPKNFGWLNENNFFPDTPAPRDHFVKRIVRKIKGKNFLPYVSLKPRPNDIILFDQRTWHMVEKPFPAIPQMLATGLFAVHPESNSSQTFANNEEVNHRINRELQELAALYVGERKMIGCDNYGKYFKNISKEKLLFFVANKKICDLKNYKDLNVKLSDNSYSINIEKTMNEYSSQARKARALNSFLQDGYTEEMLGINFSNIAEYHKSLEKPGINKERENII